MLYWCLWNEDAGEYERVSFEHAPLIYTVIQAVGLLGDGVDYTTPGALFEAMAEVFFTDATVNDKEGTKFTFDFDLKKGLDSTFSKRRVLRSARSIAKVILYRIKSREL